jgi:uncharacterized protein with ParB-like and HNH nuclease domain
MVERVRKIWDLQTLLNKIGSGLLKIPPFQRGNVWNRTKKSEAVYSLLTIGLPEITLLEEKNGSFHILDGLQRITALKEFVENGYPIRLDKTLTHVDEKLAKLLEGKKFSQLPDEVKNKLLNAEVGILIYKGVNSFEEAREIFTRLNYRPTPLNQAELLFTLTFSGEKSLLLKELGERLSKRRLLGFALLARGLAGYKAASRMEGDENLFKFKRFYDWVYANLKPLLDTLSEEKLEGLSQTLLTFADRLKTSFKVDPVKAPYWWEFLAFALKEMEEMGTSAEEYAERVLPERFERTVSNLEWKNNISVRNRQKPKVLAKRFEILSRIFSKKEASVS